ncbi:MAG TPA: hypothetical protein VKZ85_09750 [Woeseiaceae bacterium]|nr:hypothetical protein [Woeseiaceae bacterium]
MARKATGGEGDRESDRRYRKNVKESVKKTTESDRARRAREMGEEELRTARSAEEKGKSRARH